MLNFYKSIFFPITIAVCFATWFFVIPGIIGIILLIQYFTTYKGIIQQEHINEIVIKENEINNLLKKMEELGFTSYEETLAEIDRLNSEAELDRQQKQTQAEFLIKELEAEAKAKKESLDAKIAKDTETINGLTDRISRLTEKSDRLIKQTSTAEKKLAKMKELYQCVQYAIDNYFINDISFDKCKLSATKNEEYAELVPAVELRVHSMDIKALNKVFKENDKLITDLLEQYKGRYTTKTNKAIYSLIVLGLRSELQNILTNLKYDKLDNAIEQIKNLTAKYLSIAGEGNQTIAATLTKFIGATEYLFINAAKIEYDYYIKKEQARQEQIAIREQMRQEAQERKELEAEKKKIEAEEQKYINELEKVRQQLAEAAENEKAEYEAKILKLQSQLSDVTIKKDTIVNLQNGKAGNIYIISNLGSFGENVFKIGMTRRLDPQERIDELGSASVPFKFDVHSFIFSKDAVSLETALHNKLDSQRVNKVNRRKEFFTSSVDELEAIVSEIDPTAEFNKTMLAEEYRQSISGEKFIEYTYDTSLCTDNIDEE